MKSAVTPSIANRPPFIQCNLLSMARPRLLRVLHSLFHVTIPAQLYSPVHPFTLPLRTFHPFTLLFTHPFTHPLTHPLHPPTLPPIHMSSTTSKERRQRAHAAHTCWCAQAYRNLQAHRSTRARTHTHINLLDARSLAPTLTIQRSSLLRTSGSDRGGPQPAPAFFQNPSPFSQAVRRMSRKWVAALVRDPGLLGVAWAGLCVLHLRPPPPKKKEHAADDSE